MSKTTRLKTGGLQVFTVRLVVSLFRLKNSKQPVQKSNLSVLRYADYSLKPNSAWLNEPVARRQVGGDVETALTGRTSMAARATGDT